MPRTHLLVALVILACIATRVSYVHADAAVVISVGKASTQDRTTVASAVRSAARSSGWELIETPLSEPEILTVMGCLQTRPETAIRVSFRRPRAGVLVGCLWIIPD